MHNLAGCQTSRNQVNSQLQQLLGIMFPSTFSLKLDQQ